MKKIFLILFLIITAAVVFLFRNYLQKSNISTQQNNQPAVQNDIAQSQDTSNNANQNSNMATGFQAPLNKSSERVTKKPFGIYITPATSPVQPERFQGYHTGTDFEIFPEEFNIDVPVKAVCSGKLLLKRYASGYGGVAVEECKLDNNPITVIYGHLKLASIYSKTGDSISAGDSLGILGADKSAETDGERKHLHLGFYKGTGIDIKGYVTSDTNFSDWIDPCLHVCSN